MDPTDSFWALGISAQSMLCCLFAPDITLCHDLSAETM